MPKLAVLNPLDHHMEPCSKFMNLFGICSLVGIGQLGKGAKGGTFTLISPVASKNVEKFQEVLFQRDFLG